MKIIAITPNKKRDYTTEMVLEGFFELGVEVAATDVGNGINHALSDDEILSIKDADFVVAFFGKVNGNLPPRYYLLNHLRKKFSIAYVDGSEWTCTGHRNKNQEIESIKNPRLRRGEPWVFEEMFKVSKAYFKRECYPEDRDKGIIPLPFCLSKRHILNDNKKDVDVMCVFGQQFTGLRKELMQYCENLRNRTNYKIVVSNSLNASDYVDVLSRSKIVIDAWGGGDNCDRFYEAIGAKSCCLYQQYNVVVENPFVDFEHAVSFNDMESFDNNLRLLLNDERKTKKIGNSGFIHATKHHSSIVRAKKIVEKMS